MANFAITAALQVGGGGRLRWTQQISGGSLQGVALGVFRSLSLCLAPVWRRRVVSTAGGMQYTESNCFKQSRAAHEGCAGNVSCQGTELKQTSWAKSSLRLQLQRYRQHQCLCCQLSTTKQSKRSCRFL